MTYYITFKTKTGTYLRHSDGVFRPLTEFTEAASLPDMGSAADVFFDLSYNRRFNPFELADVRGILECTTDDGVVIFGPCACIPQADVDNAAVV